MPPQTTAVTDVRTMIIEQSVDIAAPPSICFESLLEMIGPRCESPDGTPLPIVVEAWPGGRVYRDLGDNAGHLWGHVQVIKPPHLLEIIGPAFMSFAVASHIQYRIRPAGGGSTLELVHTAFGLIPDEMRIGADGGYGHLLERIRADAAARVS